MVVGQFLQANPELYPGAVYVPDTGPEGVLKDADGKIFGTIRLVKYKDRTD